VPAEKGADLSLFLDILKTLEKLHAPYMVIGSFSGTVDGITRATCDLDIVVELMDEHVEAPAAFSPLPR